MEYEELESKCQMLEAELAALKRENTKLRQLLFDTFNSMLLHFEQINEYRKAWLKEEEEEEEEEKK
jgi:hypothetical protein